MKMPNLFAKSPAVQGDSSATEMPDKASKKKARKGKRGDAKFTLAVEIASGFVYWSITKEGVKQIPVDKIDTDIVIRASSKDFAVHFTTNKSSKIHAAMVGEVKGLPAWYKHDNLVYGCARENISQAGKRVAPAGLLITHLLEQKNADPPCVIGLKIGSEEDGISVAWPAFSTGAQGGMNAGAGLDDFDLNELARTTALNADLPESDAAIWIEPDELWAAMVEVDWRVYPSPDEWRGVPKYRYAQGAAAAAALLLAAAGLHTYTALRGLHQAQHHLIQVERFPNLTARMTRLDRQHSHYIAKASSIDWPSALQAIRKLWVPGTTTSVTIQKTGISPEHISGITKSQATVFVNLKSLKATPESGGASWANRHALWHVLNRKPPKGWQVEAIRMSPNGNENAVTYENRQ